MDEARLRQQLSAALPRRNAIEFAGKCSRIRIRCPIFCRHRGWIARRSRFKKISTWCSVS